MRQKSDWQRTLSTRQRAGITLALVGVIGLAVLRIGSQWHDLFPKGFAGVTAQGLVRGGRTSLPRPEGAHVVLPPGAIPAIRDPKFLPVADARVRPDAPMILVSMKGETHVYSIYLLDGHEIVNDVVGGEPIATTWWPLCASAVVYSRKMGNRTLTFGVSGMLKENALIMFDEETKSVWSHLTGEALAGSLKGSRLRRIAAVPKVRWSHVRSEYPRAKVLQVDGAVAAPISSYAAYHAGDAVGVRPMSTREDRRLAPKALVAGVAIGEAAKAYAHDLLARKRVINDAVGGTPLVVARDAAAEAVVVYDRRVAGRTLSFEAPATDGRMRDAETGTTWSILRGIATEGALRGRALTRLPHVDLYWFGWHAYHPRTEVFREWDCSE